ncbi:hypothetical protein ACFQWF_27485 [Methylorubrum suomiense]
MVILSRTIRALSLAALRERGRVAALLLPLLLLATPACAIDPGDLTFTVTPELPRAARPMPARWCCCACAGSTARRSSWRMCANPRW